MDGLDEGISPLEFAGSYATIANDGVYVEPTFYTKITSLAGSPFMESKQKKRRVFSKDVASIVKQLLTEPVKGASGTATYCNISGQDVAAKTGTTNENYDRWLCGFTNYYTAVCWYGFDMNETINYNGKNPSGLMWASVMKKIHSGLPSSRFEMSSGVVTATICRDSGKVANSYCTNTYKEYFLKGTVPETCTQHSSGSTNYIKQNTTKQTTTNTTSTNTTINNTTTDTNIENPTSNSTSKNENIVETPSNQNTTNTTNNSNSGMQSTSNSSSQNTATNTITANTTNNTSTLPSNEVISNNTSP